MEASLASMALFAVPAASVAIQVLPNAVEVCVCHIAPRVAPIASRVVAQIRCVAQVGTARYMVAAMQIRFAILHTDV
jgi:hypothetical protein